MVSGKEVECIFLPLPAILNSRMVAVTSEHDVLMSSMMVTLVLSLPSSLPTIRPSTVHFRVLGGGKDGGPPC